MVGSSLLADTHAIVWYLLDSGRLSPVAREALELADRTGTIYISTITLVELLYLSERDRIPQDAVLRLDARLNSGAGAFALAPLDRATAIAMRQIPRDIVPDMPDRIIAATGLALGLPIVTRDWRIQQAPIQTIW